MPESLNAEGAPKPLGSYANAAWERQNGRLLFVAGQVGIATDYKPPGDGGIEAQTRQTMANIQAIVEDAGGCMDDIVTLTVFVKDIAHAKTINEIRGEFFTSGLPASTLVEVSAFMHPALLVEINAVASIAP